MQHWFHLKLEFKLYVFQIFCSLLNTLLFIAREHNLNNHKLRTKVFIFSQLFYSSSIVFSYKNSKDKASRLLLILIHVHKGYAHFHLDISSTLQGRPTTLFFSCYNPTTAHRQAPLSGFCIGSHPLQTNTDSFTCIGTKRSLAYLFVTLPQSL